MQRDHVDAEYALQRRLFVEVIQDDFAHFAGSQLNHDAHAVFVRFVTEFADALDALFANKIGNLLDQAGLVDLVWQLRDDDGFFAALVDRLDRGSRPHMDPTTTGLVGGIDPACTINDAGRRKIRTWDVLHQARYIDRRIFDQSPGRR